MSKRDSTQYTLGQRMHRFLFLILHMIFTWIQEQLFKKLFSLAECNIDRINFRDK